MQEPGAIVLPRDAVDPREGTLDHDDFRAGDREPHAVSGSASVSLE